jgi:hypothetical protein
MLACVRRLRRLALFASHRFAFLLANTSGCGAAHRGGSRRSRARAGRARYRQPVRIDAPRAAQYDSPIAAAPRPAPANTKVCGQIKNGPYASYWSLVSGIKSKGTTWTVLATGVPCSYALAKTPPLLKQWAKAKLGAPLTLAGAACIKMIDRAYSGSGRSSGGFMCHRGSGAPTNVFGPNTFAARETNPYSVKQIKAFFGIK